MDDITCSGAYVSESRDGTPDSLQSQRTSDENTSEGIGYEFVNQESVKNRRINVPPNCATTSLPANCPNSTVEHRIELHNAHIVNGEKKRDRSLKMRSEFGKTNAKSWMRLARSSMLWWTC